VLLATGIVTTLGALLALGGSAALLLVVGSDEALESPIVRPRSDGVALVVDDLRAEADLLAPDGLGSLELVVRGTAPVFVGEASPAVLDEYLAGAPYDAIVSLGPVVRTSAVPGSQQPPPPTSVDIWARSAVGDPARLDLPTTAGTSLVLMRVDARPGVEVAVSVLLRLPGSWTAGWVLLGVGVALVALAVLSFLRARRPRPAPRHAAGTGTDVLPGMSLPGPAPVPSSAPIPTVVAAPADMADTVDDVVADGLVESDPTDPDAGLPAPAHDTAPPASDTSTGPAAG
jgi:hypothetical protein